MTADRQDGGTGTQQADAAAARRVAAVRGWLARVLGTWGALSLLAGAGLALAGRRRRSSRLVGAGRQTAVWGAVDLVLAVLASRGDDAAAGRPRESAASLRRLLRANAVLDVGYVAAGAGLVRRGTWRGRDVSGDGLAVVVQGAFLLALDTTAAALLAPAVGRGRTTRV